MAAASLLATDGYKFSMAEAGWPLRTETFYYSHRKGGAQCVPLDLEAELRALWPEAGPGDYEYLARREYEMGAGFKAAVGQTDRLRVLAVPRLATVLPREPILSVTGPSALVSWFEPLLLMVHYRVQVATLAATDRGALERAVALVTCERQRELVLQTLDAVGVKAPSIRVDSEGYHGRVLARARELVRALGDGGRAFEVGMRAACCLEQHEIALRACKEAGIRRTSNVLLARKLDLVPVGTMGHEHVQRYGSDEAAYRAMRDRRPQRSSFLLDTFDTLRSGIPAAYKLMQERPGAGDSIRYDSGDKEAQYRHAVAEARRLGLRPVHILEDGFDLAQTERFEALRRECGVAETEQVYGYGGYLVAQTEGSSLTRDRVAAVYKLSQTAHRPAMKFGDEAGSGKMSVPGRPVVWRRRSGAGPLGIIAQEGEAIPEGYFLLTGSAPAAPTLAEDAARSAAELQVAYSPETVALMERLRAEAKEARS